MIKTVKIYIVIIALGIGLAAGGYGGYTLGVSSKNLDKVALEDTQPKQNIYDGNTMTLTQMYDNLRSAPKDDFDHRALAYMIAIKQKELGMLHMVNEKSQFEVMKKYAKIETDHNQNVTRVLRDWQRTWGYDVHTHE